SAGETSAGVASAMDGDVSPGDATAIAGDVSAGVAPAMDGDVSPGAAANTPGAMTDVTIRIAMAAAIQRVLDLGSMMVHFSDAWNSIKNFGQRIKINCGSPA
ncbi:MAG: hypothetical protein ABEH90_00010, partial [Halolamina sp.]